MADKNSKTSSSQKSTLYIVLGICTVIALFVISAVVNTWTATKKLNSHAPWKPSKVFSSSSGEPIVAFDVDGVIFSSAEWLEAIKQIEDDSSVKGILVRVNSPGGAVAPTQEIVEGLLRLKKKRKIYCSFADVAASGGYYIATVCEKIYTNPGTITGSIGVIMPFANLQELYKFLKIEPMTIKAGKFKDMGSESRPMNADERILLQNMADEIHRQFQTAVKDARKLSDDTIASYADGRIFLGSQAVDYGFADHLGGEHEAVSALAKALKVKKPSELPRYPIPEPEYRSLFGVLSSLVKPQNSVHSESAEILKWIGSKAPELHPNLSGGKPYFLPYTWFSESTQAIKSSN